MDGQIRFEFGYLWTWKFLQTGKKKLRIQRYPDTCGRALIFPFRQTHRKHEAEYDMKNRYAYRGGCYQQSARAKQTCRTASYRDINRG